MEKKNTSWNLERLSSGNSALWLAIMRMGKEKPAGETRTPAKWRVEVPVASD